MQVNMDLYHPDDLEAFAEFCKARAATQRERNFDKEGMVGSALPAIGVAATKLEASLNYAKLSDGVIEETTSAPAAEPEKKTRSRAKKEDAPKPVTAPAPASAAVQAQDAADEKAEAATSAGGTLTHDSVREALGRYVAKYGMDAAMADGPVVVTKLFGEGKVKVSDIPDTQEAFSAAIAGIDEMLTKNPFSRQAVA